MLNLLTVIKAILVHWKGAFVRALALLLLSGSVYSSPAFARIPNLLNPTQADKQGSEAESKAVSPEQQRETTKHALEMAEAERNRAVANTDSFSSQDLKEKYRLLDGLVTRLNSQLNLIDEREGLRRALVLAEQDAKSWPGFPKPPPYSILMIDELMGKVLTARAKSQGLSTKKELLARQVTQYRESAKQAREKTRQATDELELAKSSDERLTTSWQKELAGLRTSNADAMAELIALRFEVLGERLGIAGVELDLLELQLTEARKGMVFSRSGLDKALDLLKKSRISLEQELEASLVRDAQNRRALTKRQQELDSFTLRHSKSDQSVSTAAQRGRLAARHRAALAWVESSRFETEVISALIAMNKSDAVFWEQRYVAIIGTDAEKRRDIIAELRKNVEQIKPWLEFARKQLELYQAAVREQESQLAKIGTRNPLHTAESDLFAAIRL